MLWGLIGRKQRNRNEYEYDCEDLKSKIGG